MGLKTGLKNMVLKLAGVTEPVPGFFYALGTGVKWFGKSKQEVLNKSYLDNDLVFAGVRVITNQIKICPFLLSEVVNEQKLKHYKQYSSKFEPEHQIRAMKYRAKALQEVESHPLLDLLENPNDLQSLADFLEDLFGFYNTLGTGYIYLEMPKRGVNANKPIRMYSLPAHLVDPVYNVGDWFNPISHYTFNVDGGIPIPKENIIDFRTWNPRDGEWEGLSPFDVGHRVVTRNNANQTAQTRAFQNGGRAILISGDRPEMPMDQEQLDLLTDRIRQKISGPENYRTIQASNASLKVQAIGDSPADMELIAANEADREKIAMLLGFDPILLGGSKGAKYDNMEKAEKKLITGPVMAQLNMLVKKLNKRVVPLFADGKKLFLEADTSVYPELQPDLKLMMEVYGKPRLTIDETRSVFKWDSLNNEFGDEVLIEKGHFLLSDIRNQGQVQETATEEEQEEEEEEQENQA